MSVHLSQSEVLQTLQEMDEYEFEELIADVWSEMGWKTKVTSASLDKGIDVIALRDEPFQQKHLIQAKRYAESNPVSSTEIQQYSSLKHQEPGVDAVVVVTTSYFSKEAKNRANNLNTKLVDGESLYGLLDDDTWRHILQQYVDLTSDDSSSTTDTSSTDYSGNTRQTEEDMSSGLEGGPTIFNEYFYREMEARYGNTISFRAIDRLSSIRSSWLIFTGIVFYTFVSIFRLLRLSIGFDPTVSGTPLLIGLIYSITVFGFMMSLVLVPIGLLLDNQENTLSITLGFLFAVLPLVFIYSLTQPSTTQINDVLISVTPFIGAFYLLSRTNTD